jgi:hypothetical protein
VVGFVVFRSCIVGALATGRREYHSIRLFLEARAVCESKNRRIGALPQRTRYRGFDRVRGRVRVHPLVGRLNLSSHIRFRLPLRGIHESSRVSP